MVLNITKQSGIYTLTSEQILPISMDEAWAFFTVPTNLDRITPKETKFSITNQPAAETYAGQIITYEIGILPFVKNNWITEITHFKNPEKKNNRYHAFFVDEQRFGPYAMWHHEHHFEELSNNQVKMTDIVNFKMPLGIFGDLIAGNAVKNRVKFIFESRHRILNEIFSS